MGCMITLTLLGLRVRGCMIPLHPLRVSGCMITLHSLITLHLGLLKGASLGSVGLPALSLNPYQHQTPLPASSTPLPALSLNPYQHQPPWQHQTLQLPGPGPRHLVSPSPSPGPRHLVSPSPRHLVSPRPGPRGRGPGTIAHQPVPRSEELVSPSNPYQNPQTLSKPSNPQTHKTL